MMDIIFFAAVAFYIFFKLSKHLGKIDEEEKKEIEAKVAQKKAEIIAVQRKILQEVQKQEKLVGANSTEIINSDDEVLKSLDETTKQNLITILKSSNISAEFFLKGAKSAFEMVIKAFSASDLEMLKSLLSKKIFSGFESAINQRKLEEKNLITNLISIEEFKIVSAVMIENTASITAKIVSKQINYLTDKDGKVIEGKKDEISEVNDIWTFKKDVTSNNPNWLISATN